MCSKTNRTIKCVSVIRNVRMGMLSKGRIRSFLGGFFKNPSFEIAMSGQAGGWDGCPGVTRWASSEVYHLVNLFEKPSKMLLGVFLVLF